MSTPTGEVGKGRVWAVAVFGVAVATVVQGGNVQAPWGRVQLGGQEFNSDRASRVDLLAGSVTSISGAGLALPFLGRGAQAATTCTASEN